MSVLVDNVFIDVGLLTINYLNVYVDQQLCFAAWEKLLIEFIPMSRVRP
jgi:hypothetical protein